MCLRLCGIVHNSNSKKWRVILHTDFFFPCPNGNIEFSGPVMIKTIRHACMNLLHAFGWLAILEKKEKH